ncbi:MAG: O-antigen ligase family protein [Gemmatimonadaceae bacterium]
MTAASHAGLNRAELVMLAGALAAPFNSYFQFHIGGLPLLIWGFVAGLVVIAVFRQNVVDAMDGPVLALWAMFFFVMLSTAFATPAEYKPYGIADVVVLALNLAAYSAIRCYYTLRPAGWERFFNALAISSVFMSVALVARALAAAQSGQAIGEDSYILGLGTIVGTYTSAFAAAAAVAAVFSTSRKGYLLAMLAFVVHGVAALLALARGPWLAISLAILVVIPVSPIVFRRQFTILGVLMRTASLFVALPAVAGTMFVTSPLVRALVTQRFFQIVKLDAGTGWSRVVMWKAFLRDAERSPVFGHGASAYREISESLGVHGTVSENFVVEIFHAGGGVSVLLLIAGLSGVIIYCLLRPGATERPATTAACLAGAVALILGAMTNPAAWNGLFWVMMGVVASRPISAQDVLPVRLGSRKRSPSTIPTGGAVAPSAGG